MKADADYWKGFWAGRAIAVRLAGLKSERWETLFDGEVTTTRVSSSRLNGADVVLAYGAMWFSVGDTIRLTVDKKTEVFTAEYSGPVNPDEDVYIGNLWLASNKGYESNVDSGYDYLLRRFESYFISRRVMFYSRNPGVYSVKVERLVRT